MSQLVETYNHPPTPAPTEAQLEAIRDVMRRVFFRGVDPAFLDTPEGEAGIWAQAVQRFDEARLHIVPWVERHINLRNKAVVEIGCGAGASTAAFASRGGVLHGYDIDANAIEAARFRFDVMGLRNIHLYLHEPAGLIAQVLADHDGAADVVLCYALLEHQTLEERLETLRACWRCLKPGGLLVVTDTPNRLTYTDRHTAMLPFYHMLPHDLAIAYAEHSPRASFPPSIQQARAISMPAAEEVLARWGRGVSYHEFELALGTLDGLVVGDGWDDQMIAFKPVVLDERLLLTYALSSGLSVPSGFWRQSLDLILRKPAMGEATRRAALRVPSEYCLVSAAQRGNETRRHAGEGWIKWAVRRLKA